MSDSWLSCKVMWSKTDDAEHPFFAKVYNENWKIRINDFPEEHLYTLIVEGVEISHFDDWPQNWSKG